jgi:hypothetical protein
MAFRRLGSARAARSVPALPLEPVDHRNQDIVEGACLELVDDLAARSKNSRDAHVNLHSWETLI